MVTKGLNTLVLRITTELKGCLVDNFLNVASTQNKTFVENLLIVLQSRTFSLFKSLRKNF